MGRFWRLSGQASLKGIERCHMIKGLSASLNNIISCALFTVSSRVQYIMIIAFAWALQWRHDERDGVVNHQPHDCLLNHLDQRKHQSSVSLAFMGGIHRWRVNSPHKGPLTRKMFPLDDVIMGFSFPFTADLDKHFLQVSTCRETLGRATTQFSRSSQASRYVEIYANLANEIRGVCGNMTVSAHALLCALVFPDPGQQPCRTACDGKFTFKRRRCKIDFIVAVINQFLPGQSDFNFERIYSKEFYDWVNMHYCMCITKLIGMCLGTISQP